MNVPNKELKAFKDLTPEQRSAIVEAWIDGSAEMFIGDWVYVSHFDVDIAYRTRPRQLVIPWEHIKPEYKWAAMDEDGCLCLYKAKPEIGSGVWGVDAYAGAEALNIDTTGIDWRESLAQRPE